MKKIVLLCISFIGCIACSDQKVPFGVTELTQGNQWNIKIGSTPKEVYKQLQRLGREKGFDKVDMVHRLEENVENAGSKLILYDAVIIRRPRYNIDSVYIEFKDEKVAAISRGRDFLYTVEEWFDDQTGDVPMPFAPGSTTLSIDILKRWPEETPGPSIHLGDRVDQVNEKLKEIKHALGRSNLNLVLSEKSLGKAYDPEMKKCSQWEFSFSEREKEAQIGRYSIRLYFANNTLEKIRREYR